MQIFNTKSALKSAIKSHKINGKKIGFVPTMGALHDGHLSLIEIAKENSDIVVVSIFVNPKQFGENEDLDKYPRQLETDIELLKNYGVDILFSPNFEEIYSKDSQTTINIGSIDKTLESKFRPEFLSGVMLIVAKLFNIVTPDIAVFGQKDYQQLCAVKKLVHDLDFAIDIISAPIMREESGLAMSSRNAYLSGDERKMAANIYKFLSQAKTEILVSNKTKQEIIHTIKTLKNNILNSGFNKIDYIELVDKDNLQPTFQTPAILLLAVHLGNVRLIDNMIIE